jgi:phage protein D
LIFRVDAKYGNVPYSSQYEETHYNYLARIAEAYGEQFFMMEKCFISENFHHRKNLLSLPTEAV